MPKGSAKERLEKILGERPYLKEEHHQIHNLVELVQDSLKEGSDLDTEDYLNRLEVQIDAEDKTLNAAFQRFDHSKKGQLRREDVEHMSKYLGFPHAKADIDKLMIGIDKDKSGKVHKQEFFDYVNRMGGTSKLFEERRRRAEAGGFDLGDPEVSRLALKDAGIDEEAQAYWRLVVSPSEFQEAAKLVPCQQAAVSTIRRLAKRNHELKLPEVQKRITRMKDNNGKFYKEEHLWMTLAWIRELAPVILHLNLDKMMQFIEKDTHYRNQFETATSGGLLKPAVREKWEKDLFQDKYDKAKGFDRCKYGVLNVMNDYRGVVKCKQYGDSYIILKDARLRCTFSPEDSANLKSDRLAVLDFYAHVLNEYSDDELRETVKVANSIDAAILGDSERVGAMKYKEAQIHGEVCFARHVERLVVAERHRDNAPFVRRVESVCQKHGWSWGWRDKEQERLKTLQDEKGSGMEPKTFEERLKLLQDQDWETGGVYIQEGCCKVGCGRPVQPGVTRANRPFDTCCKGCVMGFGHDLRCGMVDPKKVGSGLCKHGCGRKVAPGKDSQGRPLDTCCRACAEASKRGETGVHDETCGLGLPAAAAPSRRPTCRSPDCGRLVAPGKQPSGRPWAHCCKGCATGTGHSQGCLEEYATTSVGTDSIASDSARQRSASDGFLGGSEPVVPPTVASARKSEPSFPPPPPPASGGDKCCAVS